MILRALYDIQAERDGEGATTAEIALRCNPRAKRRPGQWTRPWRHSLFHLMMRGLVETPEGRPHRWKLTEQGRKTVAP